MMRGRLPRTLSALFWVGTVTAPGMATGRAADSIPADPPSLCLEGCTDKMSRIANEYSEFGMLAPLRPSFYSGECVHLNLGLDPNVIHHATVLIDRRPDGSPYFATTFSYFAGTDEAEGWTLREARAKVAREWLDYGPIKVSERSSHLVIWRDQAAHEPAWIYWWRRHPQTGDLYYITYWGASGGQSFCQLHLRDEEP